MKTERLNSPAFGRVCIMNSVNMSNELKTALNNSKAIKNFGKKYNAHLNISKFGSMHDTEKTYYGFNIDNIKPVNIFVSILDFFRGRKYPYYVHIVSKQTDEASFIDVINNMEKDTFTKFLKKKA